MRNTRRAEQAGFEFAAISDHFSPWLEEQGHSPFAWSVLGALANATAIGLMTAVTCPIMRYHPAIVAQAAATIALLSNNRFTLGLGSGERLNEHVIGRGWPGIAERHERLSEAIDIIKGLLAGDSPELPGNVLRAGPCASVRSTRVSRPSLAIAAGGERRHVSPAERAPALVTTERSAELVEAYGLPGAPRHAMPKYPCATLQLKTRPERQLTVISDGQ